MSALTLPGGLIVDGKLRQDFKFSPITGKLQRDIAESGIGIDNLAHQVTKILSCALITIAGQPSSQKLVRMLSTGDREFLILCLHCLIEPEAQWITEHCSECQELVQFQLHSDALPIKKAGKGYPQTTLLLTHCAAQIRVPTGADEEALADNCETHEAALALTLKRLLILLDQSYLEQGALSKKLTVQDQLLIDQLLDSMSPQISHSVKITCPYCSREQQLAIDNYQWIVAEKKILEEQIHTLAFYYHWSEKEILSLTKKRRCHYVALIESNLSKGRSQSIPSDIAGAQ